jgi:hypothetical protein
VVAVLCSSPACCSPSNPPPKKSVAYTLNVNLQPIACTAAGSVASTLPCWQCRVTPSATPACSATSVKQPAAQLRASPQHWTTSGSCTRPCEACGTVNVFVRTGVHTQIVGSLPEMVNTEGHCLLHVSAMLFRYGLVYDRQQQKQA